MINTTDMHLACQRVLSAKEKIKERKRRVGNVGAMWFYIGSWRVIT
jgi:hypothetical protein